MKYFLINNNEGIFPIDKMCKVLEVGVSSYYCWRRSFTIKKALKKEKVKELITNIYLEFK